jgi:MoaA/NifB/PqqE/SkfB family radical SAM enzyme
MYSLKPKLHEKQAAYIKGSLRTIALDVTAICNMSCKHCYAETFAKEKPVELSILKKALDEAYEMGVFHYILQGGEAILDASRLESIISMIYPDETYINVGSNGWDMSLDKIRWLKDLKVDKIAFSLDSGIEQNHDLGRLTGSFRKVIEAVDNVLTEGLDASVSCVITSNYTKTQDFIEVLNYVKSKSIRLDAQIAMPVGKWDGNLECLATEDDIKYLKELQVNCPRLKNGQEMVKRDLYMENDDHCPAVGYFMGISVNGDLLPCNFLQFSLGNIKDISINEMRQIFMKSKWFDGTQTRCLMGENREFIECFVMPHVGERKPLEAMKIFFEGD